MTEARATPPPPARRARLPRIIGLLSVVHGRFTDETAEALRDFDRIGIDVLFYKQLNRAFEGPENLPTIAEIRDPSLWLARMSSPIVA